MTETELYTAYTQAFPYGERRREHFAGLILLLSNPMNSLEYQDRKAVVTALLVLSSSSDSFKLSELWELYGGNAEGVKEMLRTVFTFAAESLPRLVQQQTADRSEKLGNVCDILQRRKWEVLDSLLAEGMPQTSEEFEAMFSDDLAYILSPTGIRNALLPHFLNHSLVGSTLSSAEEVGKRAKCCKKVTFQLE